MHASSVAESAAASPSQAAAYPIRRIAVLGAGTMGSRIAAHLANAGLPVVLLDMAQPTASAQQLAAQALEDLKKSKPAAFYEPAFAARITLGNFDDDLALLADCDWVIEAVTENLAIKQALLEKVAPHLKPDAILTTNTSGLPVRRSPRLCRSDLRRRWFGTHFFNPPRYMRLVEIIATPDSGSGGDRSRSPDFADLRLGKEVVFARDTPNFIANRIGVFIMLEAVRLMQERRPDHRRGGRAHRHAIGWPRTGTFRLADLVGLDVLAHVARNFAASVGDERADLSLPPFLETDARAPLAGRQDQAGFYKKEKDAEGKETASRSTGRRSNTSRRRAQDALARDGEERRELPERLAPAAWRRSAEGQGRALPLAAAERAVELRGGLPAARSPTTPPAWIAPCAPASTGRWGRSSSGTRRACRRLLRRCGPRANA